MLVQEGLRVMFGDEGGVRLQAYRQRMTRGGGGGKITHTYVETGRDMEIEIISKEEEERELKRRDPVFHIFVFIYFIPPPLPYRLPQLWIICTSSLYQK